ncbi:MAG: hypothetical protein QOE82_2246 [Thermoanaerobaculia bacterium]|nr:hypothetical protein [Thermoanaerobaculia bacterium]
MTQTAAEYLSEISSVLDAGYPADCVTHACRLVELLLAEGRKPWIGRLRDVQQLPFGTFHGPLTPVRLLGRKGPTWTTHYVACEGDLVYDPLVGVPVSLAHYPVIVFGREIPLTSFLDSDATADLYCRKALRHAFVPLATK